jgi:hypothetical protein
MEAGQANRVEGHVGLVAKLQAEDSENAEKLQQERGQVLYDLLNSSTLINSMWAYHKEEGDSHHDAPVLMSPQRLSIDRGWRTLQMTEWVRSDEADGSYKNGSGELTSFQEIYLATFMNMVMSGSVELVYPGPKPSSE